VYYVDKEIPQGWVRIGHLGLQRKGWDDPNNFALSVMNDILGGGGFTSRLVKRIRSDEGLAYAVGSRFGIGPYWPGEFLVSYQSKSATVAFAGAITKQEIEEMRTTKVSDQELTTSKNSFIEIFPRRFESADQIVGTFAADLYSGRPHTYWQKYRDRIRAVSADQVQKVAEKHLHPDRLLMLIVGTWDEIEPGDADGKASMKQFAGGKTTELPMLDPLTLKPLE
jgi:predicted Zn-dependent peptidase